MSASARFACSASKYVLFQDWLNVSDSNTETRLAHERGVAAFYGTGLDRVDDDLNWELTYGLWRSASDTYAQAAANMWDQLFQGLSLVPGESVVVDVAPGMGKELIHLYEKFRPKRIVGVDLTPQHVVRSNRLIAKHGLSEHIEVILGSGTQIDKLFGKEFATHVICVEGTSQMKGRVEFFRSAKAILRPGGVLGICDATLRRPPGAWLPLVQLAARAWKMPSENILTAPEFAAQLRDLGFNVTTQEIGDRVWAPYCRAKSKEFRSDIGRRGLAQAMGFALINQLLALADRSGTIGYSVVVGKT